jgi:hypothetical protein
MMAEPPFETAAKKKWNFNMETYKLHALGHYVDAI